MSLAIAALVLESPLWACRAPQQPWPDGTPISGRRRSTSRETSGYSPRSRQPSISDGPAGAGAGVRAWRRTRPCRRSRAYRETRASSSPTIQGRHSGHPTGGLATVPAGCRTAHAAGHTVSQARQPRQKDASSASVGSSSPSRPVSKARMRVMRPRGEDASSAVSAYVGHAGEAEPAGDAAVEQILVENAAPRRMPRRRRFVADLSRPRWGLGVRCGLIARAGAVGHDPSFPGLRMPWPGQMPV